METSSKITWHCRRMGGCDQVTLQDVTELRHLRDLDPKTWAALSCPTDGLEYDGRTLSLLDSDHDGRIRMPEILGAVEWLTARITDVASVHGSPHGLPLSSIDVESPDGQRLITTARAVLQHLGREGEISLTPEDMRKAVENMAQQPFNGDGIVPPDEVEDPAVREFIQAALNIVGGTRDASGKAGVDTILADKFVNVLRQYEAWFASVENAPQPVEDTKATWHLLESLRDKIDDYFLRCELALFAPQTLGQLQCESQLESLLGDQSIETDRVAGLPLAAIQPEPVLNVSRGLNPFWSAALQRFASLTRSLRAKDDVLTSDEWLTIKSHFQPYAEALAKRPPVEPSTESSFAPATDPVSAIDALGQDGVKRLLQADIAKKFHDLCSQDLASASATEDVADLEKLVLFYCNLHRLLMNFVSFFDFYNLQGNEIFRAGTLYIDSRACHLSMPVDNIEKHAQLAARSGLCLLYCECYRQNSDGGAIENRKIVAAITNGDNDTLVEGRNGVFVDNVGLDWDAKLVKIVHNPISFSQAMWSPYKRLSEFVSRSVAKYAESRKEQALISAQTRLMQTSAAVASAPAGSAQPVPFDVGRSVGIFAAIGLALGAIGTALGSIAHALLALSWWQFPLLVLGIFMTISGPSIFLAWLKFRKRALGPLLEASGWAVNKRLPISRKLASILTTTAKLPDNLERQATMDPLQDDKKNPFLFWAILVLSVSLALCFWTWRNGSLPQVLPFLSQEVQVPSEQKIGENQKSASIPPTEVDAKKGKNE